MNTLIDLSGQKFGRWTVIRKSNKKTKSRAAQWLCECSCSDKTKKIVGSSQLRKGLSKSCGCYQRQIASETHFKDLTGQVFGRWTVMKRVKKLNCRGTHWLCECSCPDKTQKIIVGFSLLNEDSKSCGCYSREVTSKRHLVNLTGQKFGRWTVIKRSNKKRNRLVYWLCECSCSKKTIQHVASEALRKGYSGSCGCRQKDASELHQKTGHNYFDYLKILKEPLTINEALKGN